MKKIFLLINVLIFFILQNFVESTLIGHYTFSTEDGLVANNVIAVWYSCANADCTQIKYNPNSNLFSSNPKYLGSSTSLDIIFPNCMETNYGYIVRFFKDGYRSFVHPSTKPPITYYCYNNVYDPWFNYNVNFDRKKNCQADFKSTIQSCAEAGLPLTILTDTNLSAETASAFSFSGYYYPSPDFDPSYPNRDFDNWIGVNTNMKVDIKKQGLSNSISGYPQTQTAFIKSIPPNNKYNFQFTWQTTKNTEPGYYVITMTSSVPDSKCDQSTMIPVSKTFNVYIAESFDSCVANVENFKLDTTNFVLNQPVVFSGKKLNSYQDWSTTGTNCDIKGTLVSETFFDTSYTLRIINQSNNQIIATKTGTLPKNYQYNTPIPFTVQWDSAKPGKFIAELTTTSTGSQTSVCENKGLTTTVSITFNIGNDNDNDKWFDIEGDCNDNDPNINPGMPDISCDGVDQNCDGVDRITTNPCSCTSGQTRVCTERLGACRIEITCTNGIWPTCPTSMGSEICNNNIDDDCDGYKDCQDFDCNNYVVNNYYLCSQKCVEGYVDLDNNLNNGCECKIETEICDGKDNDCDGFVDNNLIAPSCSKTLGVCADSKKTCGGVLGWLDCTSYGNNYELTETKCDNLDNDCDGSIDENLKILIYKDMDADGYGNPNEYVLSCTQLVGYVRDNTDCNDTNSSINPGIKEICDNNVDDDCNPNTLDRCTYINYYCDNDKDGIYSFNPSGSCPINGFICPPLNCVTQQGYDCDDNNKNINFTKYYIDLDNDGFGNSLVFKNSCLKPAGYVLNNTDCNDNNAYINPSVLEICDGIDNNCNGKTDEGCNCITGSTRSCSELFLGVCGKGIARCENGNWVGCPEKSKEICDNLDNDCDGFIDNNLTDTFSCYNSITTLQNDGVCKDLKPICSNGKWVCELSLIDVYEINETKCDNLDNDCDGLVDENLVMSTNEKGICLNNTKECINGTWLSSKKNINPVDDICGDHLDNNCDGNIDETCSCKDGDTKRCGFNNFGICSYGIQKCVNGNWSNCNATFPSQEICDGLDNDCNGKTDELIDCCLNGETRICRSKECPQSQGIQKCENYVWQTCEIKCPILLNILSPQNNKNYETCDDFKTRELEVDFEGQCEYKTQYMDNYISFENKQRVDFPIGFNILTVRCESNIKQISFNVVKANCTKVNVNLNYDTSVNKQQIEDVKKTLEKLNIETNVIVKENETSITHTLVPNETMTNLSVYLEIPKCLAEYIDDLDIDLEGYEIIQDDPIIAWHFGKLDSKIDFNYKVNKEIPTDCLEQIKFLPIADLIKKQKTNTTIFPLLISIVISSVIVFILHHLKTNL